MFSSKFPAKCTSSKQSPRPTRYYYHLAPPPKLTTPQTRIDYYPHPVRGHVVTSTHSPGGRAFRSPLAGWGAGAVPAGVREGTAPVRARDPL